MRVAENTLHTQCVQVLEKLPFIKKVVFGPENLELHQRVDARLRLFTPTGPHEFLVEMKLTHLTRAIVDGVLAQMERHTAEPWILFAPHVGKKLAAYLDERGANFVDPAGNCRLNIGCEYVAKIEGKAPRRMPPGGRGMGVAGLKILFAILVKPELMNRPARTLAEAAGVAHATVADRLKRMREEHLIYGTTPNARIIERDRLFELWQKGYEAILRPRLLIGRYRMRTTNPTETERQIEQAFGTDVAWGFGGTAGAYRRIGFYRGPTTIVHLEKRHPELEGRLPALPAADGEITLLRAPGPLAFDWDVPRTAVPLLIYTELLLGTDKREKDAAAELRRAFPEQILA